MGPQVYVSGYGRG